MNENKTNDEIPNIIERNIIDDEKPNVVKKNAINDEIIGISISKKSLKDILLPIFISIILTIILYETIMRTFNFFNFYSPISAFVILVLTEFLLVLVGGNYIIQNTKNKIAALFMGLACSLAQFLLMTKASGYYFSSLIFYVSIYGAISYFSPKIIVFLKKFLHSTKKTSLELKTKLDDTLKEKSTENLEINNSKENIKNLIKKISNKKYFVFGALIIALLLFLSSTLGKKKVGLEDYFPSQDMIKVFMEYNGDSKPVLKTLEKIKIIEENKLATFEKISTGENGEIFQTSKGQYSLTNKKISLKKDGEKSYRTELYFKFGTDFSTNKLEDIKIIDGYYSTKGVNGDTFTDCIIREATTDWSSGKTIVNSYFAPNIGLIYEETTLSDNNTYKSQELIDIIYGDVDAYDFSKY